MIVSRRGIASYPRTDAASCSTAATSAGCCAWTSWSAGGIPGRPATSCLVADRRSRLRPWRRSASARRQEHRQSRGPTGGLQSPRGRPEVVAAYRRSRRPCPAQVAGAPRSMRRRRHRVSLRGRTPPHHAGPCLERRTHGAVAGDATSRSWGPLDRRKASARRATGGRRACSIASEVSHSQRGRSRRGRDRDHPSASIRGDVSDAGAIRACRVGFVAAGNGRAPASSAAVTGGSSGPSRPPAATLVQRRPGTFDGLAVYEDRTRAAQAVAGTAQGRIRSGGGRVYAAAAPIPVA